MGDLCHQYFIKKPVFLSIDVEGVGYNVLIGNDWNNPKCVPDIIVV